MRKTDNFLKMPALKSLRYRILCLRLHWPVVDADVVYKAGDTGG